MNEPNLIIDIDRIVLTDLNVTPDQAERIRGLVEAELGHLLTRGNFVDSVGNIEVAHLKAPTIHLGGLHNDNRLANGIAQGIAQSLHGVNRQEQGG
jgi:hypothetical protein